MRNLLPPVLNGIAYFDKIVEVKKEERRNRLQNLRPTIDSLFVKYTNKAQILHQLQPNTFSDDEKKDLLHCYEIKTKPLHALKAAIRSYHNQNCSNVAALCQYCGLSYNASSIDHYLPQKF